MRTTDWSGFAYGQGSKRTPIRPPAMLAGHYSRTASVTHLNAKLDASRIDRANGRKGGVSLKQPSPIRVKTCKCTDIALCTHARVVAIQPKLGPKATLRWANAHESNPAHVGHALWLESQLDVHNVAVPTGYANMCHWCMYGECKCSWLDRMVRALQSAGLVAKGRWQEIGG